MPKYRCVINVGRILGFIVLISGIYIFVSAAEGELVFAQSGYKKVYPVDVSPKPAIIQDREFMHGAGEDMAVPQATEAEDELRFPGRRTSIISGEPAQVHYQIAVNDKLFIGVWRVKDLSLDFVVGPDGKISFPLIGDIDAANRTLAEVDAEITEKLREYVVNPEVSVMVKEFAGDKLIVLGEIKKPGIYKFIGRTNIMHVVALAGGFTDRAKSSYIVIVREYEDPEYGSNLINVPIKSILKGNVKNNIEVRPNDIIYVSRTFVSNLKEFYDDWLDPALNTVVDFETMRSLRRTRLGRTP
jgi:polysaccharide export outer membrane protein